MIFSSDRARLNSESISQVSDTPSPADRAVPITLSIWDFLFDSDYSPLGRTPAAQLAGFSNAATKERVRYDTLKEYTSYLSTALVRKYGLRPNDTVALFSPNTIWYPVAMLRTVRAGV